MPTLPPVTDTAALDPDSVARAMWIVELAASLSDAKDRRGGYLFVLDVTGEASCNGFLVFSLDQGRHARYRTLAEEKARRLASHPEHKTSFESRDEASERYQGAIRCPDGTCIGFSGRPSDEDEAICLMYAMCQGLLTDDEAKEIAKISGNTFFGRMLDASD